MIPHISIDIEVSKVVKFEETKNGGYQGLVRGRIGELLFNSYKASVFCLFVFGFF